jgi:hypothetical protein
MFNGCCVPVRQDLSQARCVQRQFGWRFARRRRERLRRRHVARASLCRRLIRLLSDPAAALNFMSAFMVFKGCDAYISIHPPFYCRSPHLHARKEHERHGSS